MGITNKLFFLTCISVFLGITLTATAQNLKISGVVSDAGSGEVLVGVTVMIKGSSIGTTTGSDGK